MDNNRQSKHYIGTLATLLIFAIFAVCIIVSILAGARVYKKNSARDTSAYNMRTCTQYISNKIRSAQSPDCITVVDFADGKALRIDEETGGEEYCTFIYYDDGWLKEFYSKSSSVPSPKAGEKLIELDGLAFDYSSGLVSAFITLTDGTEQTLYISVRGAEVVK